MAQDDRPAFLRMARPSDVEACRQVDVEAWGPDAAASAAMLAARIARYPSGNFVALDAASRTVGAVWTVATRERPVGTWHEMSGGGTYEGCDPHGDVLFGANLSVPPAQAGRGIGQQLVRRAVEAAWIAGKRLAILGTRIPDYHGWQAVFSAEDYVRLRVDAGRLYFLDPASGMLHAGPSPESAASGGVRIDPRSWRPSARFADDLKILDRELRFFMGVDVAGERCRTFRTLPDYFPDPDSCDHGVLIGWENPAHPGFGLYRP